jgi:hypothetical protein
LRLKFWMDEEWSDYLSADLLPENYIGTPVQVRFYNRIHADLRRIAAETHREITKAIDDESLHHSAPDFRKLMYDLEGETVPPDKPSWVDRLETEKTAKSDKPAKPPEPVKFPTADDLLKEMMDLFEARTPD